MIVRVNHLCLWAIVVLVVPVSGASGQNLSQDEVFRMYDAAMKLTQQGKLAEAAATYEKMLPSAERVFGKDGKNTATILNNLGFLNHRMGQFEKAEMYHSRSLKIRETKLTNFPLDIAMSLNNLATTNQSMGRYATAEPLFHRSLKIYESKLGKNHPEVAQSLNNFGAFYQDVGRYADAEAHIRRGLEIREANFGKKHPDVAQSYNNLAVLFKATGQYARSEQFQLRALEIWEAHYGKDHLEVARSLNNLASLYQTMGQADKAEPLYLRSMEIREAKGGKGHPEVANSLNNLASLYRERREYDKAEQFLLRSLEIREARFGKDHPLVASSLSNLGGVYYLSRQYNKAEPLFQRTLEIREARLGKDHPLVAQTLGNLAKILEKNGQHALAEPLFHRSVKIFEKQLGQSHPDMAASLHFAAWNFAAQEKWGDGIKHAQSAREAAASQLALVLPRLSEKEQMLFLEHTFKNGIHKDLSIGWMMPKEAAGASAEWLLNGKAIAHQSLAEQQMLARDARDPEARKIVADLQDTRSRLAAFANRLPRPGMEAEYQKELQNLRSSEQELAQKLARAVGQPSRVNSWVTLNSLRAKLGPKAVFVDIARFPAWDFKAGKSAGPRYVAWITPPKGDAVVQVIDLGDAEPIDQLIEQTRKALIESAKSVTKVGEIEATEVLDKPLQALSAKVLHPLLPTLERYEEWIVCPDGALWLTPWNALLLKDGKHAVEKYLLRHVVSGRDLVLELPKTRAESVHIFADPDYDLNPGKVLALAGVKVQDDREDVRSVPSVLGTLPKVKRLPGTALEAEGVRLKIEQWLGKKPMVYLEGQASEATLKAVKNPRILTLATHGYFLPAQEVEQKNVAGLDLGEGKDAPTQLDKKGQPIENPLLRCGLLLAGCNKRTEAKAGEDDGILTGLEIVGLNLNGCELVVLSACETGLGDVRSGEGVAGLRQAFQLAGAKAVLASLWQVPDRETALLMNTFYGEIAKGRSQAEALRAAQLQRIAARRAQFGAAHPFFWSAFALTSRGAD